MALRLIAAVDLKPEDPDYAYNLGRAYLYAGRLDDAEAKLRRSLELKPISPRAYNILGLVMVAREEHGRAAEHFRKVIELDPKMLDGYQNLASALADLGDYEEAAHWAEQAIEVAHQLELDHAVIDRIRARVAELRGKAQGEPIPVSP